MNVSDNSTHLVYCVLTYRKNNTDSKTKNLTHDLMLKAMGHQSHVADM